MLRHDFISNKSVYAHTYIYTPITGINATVCSTPAESPGIVSPRRPGCHRGRATHTFAHGELEAQGCWDLIKVMSLCTWGAGSSRLLGLDQGHVARTRPLQNWLLGFPVFTVSIWCLLAGWQKLTNWIDQGRIRIPLEASSLPLSKIKFLDSLHHEADELVFALTLTSCVFFAWFFPTSLSWFTF